GLPHSSPLRGILVAAVAVPLADPPVPVVDVVLYMVTASHIPSGCLGFLFGVVELRHSWCPLTPVRPLVSMRDCVDVLLLGHCTYSFGPHKGGRPFPTALLSLLVLFSPRNESGGKSTLIRWQIHSHSVA